MLERLRSRAGLQKVLALLLGVGFGFLLQRGGVTRYEIIMGQLLLVDWTVFKVIMSAILTGMVGLALLRRVGAARLHSRKGAWGSAAVGGLIFGLGFGILGYCPGTTIGAVGQGSLDALFGGAFGMLAGASLFAAVYERVEPVQSRGAFPVATIPELLGLSWPKTAALILALAVAAFLVLEMTGL